MQFKNQKMHYIILYYIILYYIILYYIILYYIILYYIILYYTFFTIKALELRHVSTLSCGTSSGSVRQYLYTA